VRSWIKKLNHPSVPALLLVLLAVEWMISQRDAQRLEEIANGRVTGPEVPLDRACAGTWTLEWPAWDERKGEAILVALGLPPAPPSAPHAHPIMLRVHPPDAVRLARDRSFDSDGWFAVWNSYDYATVAYLDHSRARTVEYRVAAPAAAPGSVAVLAVEGEEGPLLLEGVLVRQALDNILAVALGIPLLIWLLRSCLSRWKMRSVGPVGG
jgi:hypothetical protein